MRAVGSMPQPVSHRLVPLIWSANARALARERVAANLARVVLPLIAISWVILVFSGIVWIQHGLNPRYFSAPDETVNRHAAELVAHHARPFDPVATSDTGDVLHERLWLTVGDHAIPAYPPTGYYIQGALLAIPGLGLLLIAAIPALGAGAFAAGAGNLVRSRRILAATAPMLAFPALYWMMRPWMNMSLFLSFFCFAFFFWSLWLRSRSAFAISAAMSATALAAAVRPDYAVLVLGLALVAAVIEGRDGERKRLIAAIVLAGMVAVAINLLLNAVTTGKPFTTAYAIWDQRNGIHQPWSTLPAPVSALMYLLLPYGIPHASEAMDQVQRYWIHLGPMGVILASQVTLVALLMRASRRRAVGYAAVALIALLFVATHISPDIYGAGDDVGLLRHSVTRYWTPVYLLVAIPPLLWLMTTKREWVGVGVLVVVAVLGARTIFRGQPESLESMRSLYTERAAEVTAWQHEIPPGATVFTVNMDKLLWGEWDIATLAPSGNQDAAANASDRLISSGHAVYIAQVGLSNEVRTQLNTALAAKHFALTSVNQDEDVFEVRPSSSP